MKLLMLSTAFVVLAAEGSALAAASPVSKINHHRHRVLMQRVTVPGNGVASNGRCHGISYGTGARRCDSMTGGPSGGLTNRN